MFIRVLSFVASAIGKSKLRPVTAILVLFAIPVSALAVNYSISQKSNTGATKAASSNLPSSAQQLVGTNRVAVPKQSARTITPASVTSTDNSSTNAKDTTSNDTKKASVFSLSTDTVVLAPGAVSGVVTATNTAQNKLIWTSAWTTPGSNPELQIVPADASSNDYSFKITASASLATGSYQLSIQAKDSVTGTLYTKLVTVTVSTSAVSQNSSTN